MSAPVIPGYTFVEHLGSGGFADVYCYEQEWPQQRVAVKVVREDVALNDRERALFTSEANAMARLGDHPNIVPVLTAGVTADNRPFLVMRFCPPPDLGVRVRSSPLSVADAVSTGIKLASAIETAHRAGTVHRDIKPSNVLVTSYHEPALTDFGIAGRLQEVAGDDEVRISYPWSPPEMLDGRSNGSIASDVYSLGATIWHLLVGRSPYSIPGRRQLDPCAERADPARGPSGDPASRRAAGAGPAAPADDGQAALAPPAERDRPGPVAPADRGRGRLPAHGHRGRGGPRPERDTPHLARRAGPRPDPGQAGQRRVGLRPAGRPRTRALGSPTSLRRSRRPAGDRLRCDARS